jgi:hypothetical protein
LHALSLSQGEGNLDRQAKCAEQQGQHQRKEHEHLSSLAAQNDRRFDESRTGLSGSYIHAVLYTGALGMP